MFENQHIFLTRTLKCVFQDFQVIKKIFSHFLKIKLSLQKVLKMKSHKNWDTHKYIQLSFAVDINFIYIFYFKEKYSLEI